MQLTPEQARAGYYNAAGKRIPSVTTVAKLISTPDPLIHWAWNLGMEGKDYRAVRDEAATAGHICHSQIECAIRGSAFVPDPNVDPETLRLAGQGFQAFQTWLSTNNFQLLHTEMRVISERYQYGGRLDCIATVNGEPCIVDWKTSGSRRMQEAWLPQVAAYRQAWNETHRNEQIKSCHFMVLAKADAGFSHHYFPESSMDAGWRAFLACLELYNWKKKIGKLI